MELWRVFLQRFLVSKMVKTSRKGVFAVINLLPKLKWGLKSWIVLVDTEVAERSIFAPKELFLIFAELAMNSCCFGEGQGNHLQAIFAEKTWSPSSSGWIHLDNLRFPKSWWYPEKSSSLFRIHCKPSIWIHEIDWNRIFHSPEFSGHSPWPGFSMKTSVFGVPGTIT